MDDLNWRNTKKNSKKPKTTYSSHSEKAPKETNDVLSSLLNKETTSIGSLIAKTPPMNYYQSEVDSCFRSY